MLLAVNANSPFKELCKGWTKNVRVFSTSKSRVGWAIKLLFWNQPKLSFNDNNAGHEEKVMMQELSLDH